MSFRNFSACLMTFAFVLVVLNNAEMNFADEPKSPDPGKQIETSFKTKSGREIPFLFYLPADYDQSKTYPLMLFLHGRGESYGPLEIVAKWGPPRMAARGDKLPYILISPQCPGKSRWADDEQQAGLIELLDFISAHYAVDSDRIYLTGLSMGGYGTWRLAADHPERFAAAVPICGGGNPADASKLTKLPIWVFHGDKDQAVPFQRSVEMVEAIRAKGGTKIRFTSLEEIGHNSWSAAYATPELYTWMMEQTISGNK